MNKVLSAYDLVLADPLKGMTQFDAINLDNLDKVNNVLATLGFDIDKPICVETNYHRTMSGEVRVGYMFKGYLSRKREHVFGKYSTVDDMFAYAEGEGQEWYDELMALSSRAVNYCTDDALDDKIAASVSQEHREEEQRILNEIKQLDALLYLARGDQRKPDGSYKTYADYKTPESVPEKRKRSRRKNVEKGMGE